MAQYTFMNVIRPDNTEYATPEQLSSIFEFTSEWLKSNGWYYKESSKVIDTHQDYPIVGAGSRLPEHGFEVEWEDVRKLLGKPHTV